MESHFTLGGDRRKKNQNDGYSDHVKSTTLNAGSYSIDVIRKSINHDHNTAESAKFNSNYDSPRLPPAHMMPGDNTSSLKKDSESKKLVTISLAPELLEAFANRKATYVIRKNERKE
jgi:hypothetical protein